MRHNFSISLPTFSLFKYIQASPSISYGMNWFFSDAEKVFDQETQKVVTNYSDPFSTFGITQNFSAGLSLSKKGCWFPYLIWFLLFWQLFFPLFSFRFFLNFLKETLPKADIYCLINTDIKPEIASCMKNACEKYHITPITFNSIDKKCGHPTIQGMKDIKESVLSVLNK